MDFARRQFAYGTSKRSDLDQLPANRWSDRAAHVRCHGFDVARIGLSR